MLRSVFIGQKFPFNQLLIHWLAQRTDLAGVLWVDSSAWHRSPYGLARHWTRRVKRRGLVKALDEAAFYLAFHKRSWERTDALLQRFVIDPYVAHYGPLATDTTELDVADVAGQAAQSFMADLAPDVAFAQCISQIIPDTLFRLPPLGLYLWHEGLTPAYRGLHCPFWTFYNLDFSSVGSTLLRVDEGLDSGDAYVYTVLPDVDMMTKDFGYLGHLSIAESLPAVETFLGALEGGTATIVPPPLVGSRLFTYPGLTNYVVERVRVRRLSRIAPIQSRGMPQ